jgi:hypothetical protein
LILEVDVTTSSVDQRSLYAAIKVPEVWIHDGESLRFLVRNRRGKYEERHSSMAFPFLRPVDIEKYVKQHAAMNETELTRAFVTWARRCRDQWKQKQSHTSAPKRKLRGRKQ